MAAPGRLGFVHVGQRGNHVKLKNEAGRVVIIPMHRELAVGTPGSIFRQAGFDRLEFTALLIEWISLERSRSSKWAMTVVRWTAAANA